MHHLIVGNGIAGFEAARVIRARDADARITLVSAEHPHLFARTALMYVLCGQLSLRDTEPYDRDTYARLRLERVAKRVVAVDAARRALRFEDGATLEGDRLLLAVGSRARPAPWPGGEGPGVYGFVTLADLERLDAAARPGMRVVVIGGGLIGVEVAEVLLLRGLRVTFVIREPWYFPVALDAREAAVVAAHVRGHGVDVRLGAEVESIERGPDGAVRGVRIPGEELPADLVVVAIGVVPATGFLAGSGLPLAASGAIETADDLSVPGCPGVFAAGDCANVTWVDGSRRPETLWYTARDQGRAAGAAMLGDPVRYRRETWYNSAKFFDLEYTTAGFVPPAGEGAGYRTWFQQAPERAATWRLVCKGERVVGFNALGTRWDHARILGWIRERRELGWVLRHLDEARFDEEFEPPFRVLPTATITEGA